jgi:hypothetical protein
VSESHEQQTLFHWAKLNCMKHPELELLHAIPNSGKRHIITAARMKAEGQLAGVCDIFLPVARQGYHGLYIELKIKGNKATKNQEWFIEKVTAQQYKAVVCVGWEKAKDEIERYLA